MNKKDTVNTMPFAGFRRLFKKDADQFFCLNDREGFGSMRKLRIEEGVTACIWNFSLKQNIKIKTDYAVSDKQYCIAFFPDSSPLTLCDGDRLSNKNGSWDIIFNRSSDFYLALIKDTKYRCLTIHFSESWLKLNSYRVHLFSKTLSVSRDGLLQISAVDMMSAVERDLVSQLLDKSFVSFPTIFFAKAAVLKMTGDFLQRIEHLGCTPMPGGNNVAHEVEKILSLNMAMMEPDVKRLARLFSISQSTLNRRFKACYGHSIAAGFFKKRMDLARVLIEERGLSAAETAFILGYKTYRNFIRTYEKYSGVGGVRM